MDASHEAQPVTKYDTSHISKEFVPSKKWFGHQLRIDKDNTVHIDSTFGKYVRQRLCGSKYATAQEATDILKGVAADKQSTTDSAVIVAAVKTLVHAGKGLHEIQKPQEDLITASFTYREIKVYNKLMEKPEIAALSRHLDLETNDHPLEKKLQTLKEYGVDLEKQTLNADACAGKLALEFADRNLDVMGRRMDITELKKEIKGALADVKSKRESNIPGELSYTSAISQSLQVSQQQGELVELNKYSKEIFGIAPNQTSIDSCSRKFKALDSSFPEVQARFLTDAVKKYGNNVVIGELFSEMSDDAKEQFAVIGLAEAWAKDQNHVIELLERCPNIREYCNKNHISFIKTT